MIIKDERLKALLDAEKVLNRVLSTVEVGAPFITTAVLVRIKRRILREIELYTYPIDTASPIK